MDAIRRTDGTKINYTPAGAIAAGEVVDLGDILGVAERAIAAAAVGALSLEGEFSILKSGSTGPVFAVGDAVFWDTVNSLAVRTGGAGCLYVGTCTAAATTSETTVRTLLAPQSLPGLLADMLWEDVDISGGSKTLDIEDVGKVLNVTVGHASNVITLPAVAAGLGFCVRCGTAGQRVAISPNASDKIMGADLAGTDNKDQILAAATSRKGDYIAFDYLSADGWGIRARRGVWAAES
jgi:predicted RecA/RadA family phage recombinase